MTASAVFYLAHHLPPFSADPRVFGDWEATEPPRGLQGVLRECREHEVTWRGEEPCWECADKAAEC